ncbi:MAG: FAD-binding oxidoreductase, partial [Chloroflexota bacterium]
AEVIIIGAGVIGNSIAFHLAKLGCHDVLVLEKNYIGSGATEKCAGGIRQQFSTEANIRLSVESVRFFQNFEEETGYAADFRQHGYLILATTENEMETFRQNIKLQRKFGIDVELLSPAEVSKLVPWLNVTDILGATFCRTDGYADPYSVVNGFAGAARRMGIKILEDAEVIGIDLKGNRVEGVLTTAGRFNAPIVVNAAGPYAAVVGRMTGSSIPVHPTRRHILVSEPVFSRDKQTSDIWWQKLPQVIDFHNGFWFRREGPSLLFGMRNQDEPESFSTEVDWDFFTNALAPAASHRLPKLADTGIMRAQAGLHPDTADDMAIMGRVPDIRGLYIAGGFCGHGFMHSPAAGRLMAELISGKIASLSDAEVFNLERFQGRLNQKEKAFI